MIQLFVLIIIIGGTLSLIFDFIEFFKKVNWQIRKYWWTLS